MSINAFDLVSDPDKRRLCKMYIEKLTCEIEGLRAAKQLAFDSRKNLLLKISLLHVKRRKLEREIRQLRNCGAAAPPPGSIGDNPHQSITDIKIPKSCSPYILLMPSSDTSANRSNRMKFQVQKIFDENIDEMFELVNEEPFEIVPMSKDVIMHIEHLEKIKSIILQHNQKKTNTILKISIVQEAGLPCAIKNVPHVVNIQEDGKRFIDLTDGEDVKDTNKVKRSSDIETDIESHKIFKPVVIEDNEEGGTNDKKKRKKNEAKKPDSVLINSSLPPPLSLSDVLGQNVILYPANNLNSLYYFIPNGSGSNPNIPAINEDKSSVGTNDDVIEIS